MSGFMSPRDQFGLFRAPVSVRQAVVASDQIVAAQNPDRILIAFLGGVVIHCGFNTSVMNNVNDGWIINGTVPQLTFTQRDHASLVQSEWHAFPAVGGFITVVELILNRWPNER